MEENRKIREKKKRSGKETPTILFRESNHQKIKFNYVQLERGEWNLICSFVRVVLLGKSQESLLDLFGGRVILNAQNPVV